MQDSRSVQSLSAAQVRDEVADAVVDGVADGVGG